MLTCKETTTRRSIHLARVGLYRGVQARVAKKLKVSAGFVSRVARGEKKSSRVMRALEQEANAIETQIEAR